MLRPPPPPYAVAGVEFRFPSLAALAGRLPIGSGREAVLAALLTARMAAESAPQVTLAKPLRVARAAAARQWLTAMCPDARVRAACAALTEATEDDDPKPVARSLQRVIDVTAAHLDAGARSELGALVALLGGEGASGRGGERGV